MRTMSASFCGGGASGACRRSSEEARGRTAATSPDLSPDNAKALLDITQPLRNNEQPLLDNAKPLPDIAQPLVEIAKLRLPIARELVLAESSLRDRRAVGQPY
jgi:hypothetical protein